MKKLYPGSYILRYLPILDFSANQRRPSAHAALLPSRSESSMHSSIHFWRRFRIVVPAVHPNGQHGDGLVPSDSVLDWMPSSLTSGDE